jgi:hypothetical protein
MDVERLIEIFAPEYAPPMENRASYQVGGHHYARLSVQPWEAMEAWMAPEEFRGFLRGNAIKYLARVGRKPGATEAEDLRKARHYLERLIATYRQPPVV